MIKRWMEITFILILLYLVLSRSSAFASAIKAIGSVYTQAGRMLQGR